MALLEASDDLARINALVKDPGFPQLHVEQQVETLGIAVPFIKNENPYERHRRMRMLVNKKRIEVLQIRECAEALTKYHFMRKPKPPKKKAVRRNVVPASDIAPRRSGRNTGHKRDYAEIGPRYDFVEPRQCKARVSRGARGVGTSVVVVFPEQSKHAIEAAEEAAFAKAAEFEAGRAFAKNMLPSNVQGGFWQQLPSEMQVAWPFEHSTRIELECDDVSKKQGEWTFQEGENERRWPTVWLPRGMAKGQVPRRAEPGAKAGRSAPTTAGLSGGWRGFALDQKLTPSDSVCWEIPADVPFGTLPTYIKIHLFRAENYETEESLQLVRRAEQERKQQEERCEAEVDREEAAAPEEEGADAEEAADGNNGLPQAAEPISAGKRAKTKKAGTGRAAAPRKAKVPKKAAGKGADEDDAPATPPVPDVEPRGRSLRRRKPSAPQPSPAEVLQRQWNESQRRLDELAHAGEASGEEFDVEIILNVRKMKSANPVFFVKWAGYNDPADNTWEPVSMFAADVLQYKWAEARLKAQARKHSHKWKQ